MMNRIICRLRKSLGIRNMRKGKCSPTLHCPQRNCEEHDRIIQSVVDISNIISAFFFGCEGFTQNIIISSGSLPVLLFLQPPACTILFHPLRLPCLACLLIIPLLLQSSIPKLYMTVQKLPVIFRPGSFLLVQTHHKLGRITVKV